MREVKLSIWQLVRKMRQDRLGMMREFVGEDDIVCFRVAGQRAYIVNSPSGVRHVLQKSHKHYRKPPNSLRALGAFLGEGLLLLEGDPWLARRRQMQPSFRRGDLANLAHVVTEEAAACAKRWEALAATGAQVDLTEEMTEVTLRVVSRSMLGVDVEQEAAAIGAQFAHVINEMLNVSPLLVWLFMKLPWVPFPQNKRYKQNLKQLNERVYGIIDARRESLARGEAGNDLLTKLMQARDEETGEQLSSQELRDEVMTLWFAGHETTSVALTWTWYLLLKHPEVMAKLRVELADVLGGRAATIEDMPALSYTAMIVKESMRMYPPAAVMGRFTLVDDEVEGVPIPAGVKVTISPYLMHQRADVWPEPGRFDPERFRPEAEEARDRFAYIPFGAGPRRCIGEHFAMMEAVMVLATLAQQFSPELVSSTPLETGISLALRPKEPLLIKMHAA